MAFQQLVKVQIERRLRKDKWVSLGGHRTIFTLAFSTIGLKTPSSRGVAVTRWTLGNTSLNVWENEEQREKVVKTNLAETRKTGLVADVAAVRGRQRRRGERRVQ